MPDLPSEWVTYDPPKSAAFGHRIGGRSNRKAWERVAAFLKSVTSVELHPYSVPTLRCCLPHPSTETTVAMTRIAEAEQAFGAPSGRSQEDFCWKLRADQVAQAVSFALDDDKYPEQANGPSKLELSYLFAWPQFPTTKLPHVTLGPRNSISVWIGKSVLGGAMFVQPSFQIPLAWNSPEFRTFLLEAEPKLPFKLSDNNFRRWLLPASPENSGQSRKLEKGWRRQWQTH
jgi:hypothetical protein